MKHIKSCIVGLAVLATAFSASAGAYQLNDYSVTGLGRAYAGQGIMGDDYSAIAFNPAGMTLMKKSGIQTGVSFVNLGADVDGLDAYEGQHKKMNFWVPIPQFFAQYNVNDKLFLGMGAYAPFGLKTQYDADWFASDTAVLSKLDIMDLNVSAAYKINEHWSVGASAVMRYIYGKMTNTVSTLAGGGKSEFDVHGWSQTATLGVMYEPTENTRFGLSYRLRSAQRAKGDFNVEGSNNTVYNPALGGFVSLPFDLNGEANVWANPDLPETITFSGYHRYKNVGFSGTARWTHWTSSFPEFTVYSDAPLMQTVYKDTNGANVSHYNYDNSWTLTAGLDWYYNKNWTFRFGTGWDESPTHNDTTRTIRIPDNDRFWLSAGASYIQDNWQVDVGYAHMFGRTGKALEESDISSAPVKYKNLRSNILGLQVQYKF